MQFSFKSELQTKVLLWSECLHPHQIHYVVALTPNVMVLGDWAYGR